MWKRAIRFKISEKGAVSVDFVILTASVVGLGLALIATFADGAMDAANLVTTRTEERGITQFEAAID